MILWEGSALFRVLLAPSLSALPLVPIPSVVLSLSAAWKTLDLVTLANLSALKELASLANRSEMTSSVTLTLFKALSLMV